MLTCAGFGKDQSPSQTPLEAARCAAFEEIEVVRVGLGEVEFEVPCRGNGHVIGPDVHGQGLSVGLLNAVDADEGAPSLGVSDPDRGAQSGRVAHIPGVGEVIRGTRLARGGMPYLLVQIVEHRRRAVLHHAPEDLGLDGRLVARENALTADLVVVDGFFLAIGVPVDALYGVRLAMDAAAGESRVGGSHIERAYARTQAAYRGRGVGVDGRGDTQVFGGLDDVVQSNVDRELYEYRIVRLRHGVGQGDLSPLYVVVVVYLVVLVVEVEGQFMRNVGALRRDIFLQGGGEYDRLEGAAGLTSGVESEVEITFLTCQGAYGAALGFYGHDGRRRVSGLREHLIRGLDGSMLQAGVHSGVDSQPPEAQGPWPEFLLHLTPDLLEERRVGRIFGRRAGGKVEGRRLGLLALLGGDPTLLLHQPQHLVSALADRSLDNVTLPGRVGRRGVEQTGEHRRLREVEIPGALAEVTLRGLLGAVGAAAEVDGVQVGGKDLVLGVLALVGEGEGGLYEAPAKRGLEALVLGNVEVLHELLRNRRAALLYLQGSQVRPGRAGEPFEVDAEVVVEAAVLDGDDCCGEGLAEAFETDGLTALGDGDLAYHVPVYVVDVGILGELGVGPVEIALVLPQDEHVQARNANHNGQAEDQTEVEEGAQAPLYRASQLPPLRLLFAGFEEVVHGPPTVVYPTPTWSGRRRAGASNNPADGRIRACP